MEVAVRREEDTDGLLNRLLKLTQSHMSHTSWTTGDSSLGVATTDCWFVRRKTTGYGGTAAVFNSIHCHTESYCSSDLGQKHSGLQEHVSTHALRQRMYSTTLRSHLTSRRTLSLTEVIVHFQACGIFKRIGCSSGNRELTFEHNSNSEQNEVSEEYRDQLQRKIRTIENDKLQPARLDVEAAEEVLQWR